jgi:hypothetical protein
MVSASVSSLSPQAIKTELVTLLGSKGRPYWRVLSDFLKAKISRAEFEELVTEWINTTRLGKTCPSALFALYSILTRLSHSEPPQLSSYCVNILGLRTSKLGITRSYQWGHEASVATQTIGTRERR